MPPYSAGMTTPHFQQEPLEQRLLTGSPGRASGTLSTVLQVLLLLTTLSGVSLVLCTVAAGAFG